MSRVVLSGCFQAAIFFGLRGGSLVIAVLCWWIAGHWIGETGALFAGLIGFHLSGWPVEHLGGWLTDLNKRWRANVSPDRRRD